MAATKKAAPASTQTIVDEPIEVTTEPIPVVAEPLEDHTETPRGRLARLAKATVLVELVQERVTALRTDVDADVRADYQANANTTKGIVIDGIGKVGSITVPLSNDATSVADVDAYTAWVEENYPTEVEYKTVVKSTFQKGHLAGLVGNAEDGTVVDARTGEVVPGVKFKVGGEVKSPRLVLDKAKKVQIAELLLEEPIDQLLALSQPELGQ